MKETNGHSLIKFLNGAFNYQFSRINEGRMEGDDFPLSIFEKVNYIIGTLTSKEKTERLLKLYSAINYGADILNTVFPKCDNPANYHSTDTEIRLNEKPVQVIGWKEYEELVEKGVETGLNRDEIICGFFLKAQKRGINLEWSFHSEVSTTRTDPAVLTQKLL